MTVKASVGFIFAHTSQEQAFRLYPEIVAVFSSLLTTKIFLQISVGALMQVFLWPVEYSLFAGANVSKKEKTRDSPIDFPLQENSQSIGNFESEPKM